MDTEGDSVLDTDNSTDYVPSLEDSGASNYNYNLYNRYIKGVMACGVSNRDAAKLANDFYLDLVDLNLIQYDESLLLTESKIVREKDRIGKDLIQEHEATVIGLESIGNGCLCFCVVLDYINTPFNFL